MTESINPTPVPRMPPQAEDQSLAAGGAGGSEPCSEALLETFDMSVGSSPSEFPKGDVPTGDDLLGAFMRQAERARPKTKSDQVGDRFGNYKLLEQIGEGGFGVVWAADQEHPVRRRVALKIVKLGMDTKEVIARFEQERQALAMMDHPNIAKVFDAGATPTGRPYFVMELVRGIKITDYCDQAKLSTSERLELFITVCHAVQHAHQKGIIHRDLKPSNILVTLHDAVAVPKVIDFGVAKAMQHQRLTDLTIYTQFEQMIGTPLYMSPEQAQMSGLDVDTRSDIYSLGVLLYELLTGRTPFDPQKLMRQGLDDIRRSICDQEPPKPSAALHTMALATRNTIAQRRHVDPGKLLSLVRGDLDWIVMKALEKDRSRRYDTSAELAKDIQRHLAHEPVHARAPTQLYRFRRLVRRNRFTFAAIGAVAAALVVGLSVATYSFISERQARKSEAEQRILAEHHSQQARASAELAEASEFKATHLLYATDMHLAHEAIRSNNIGLARRLLDRHRPAQGEPDLRDWEWRYLYQECLSRAQATLTRREGKPVFAASYSPDGTLLLLGFSDGRVELWNVAARKLRRLIYPSAEAQVARAVFSPGGNTIAATATTGDQRMVRIVDINSGAERTLCTVPGVVRDLSYSRDGAWLAVLSRDPDRVVILGVDDGKPVMNYSLREGGGAFFNNVRISPDKERIYVSSGAFGEPIVQCVSIPDGRVFWEHPIGKIDDSVPEAGSDMGFSAMDLSPDGHALAVATGYRDSQLRILDAGSGNLITKRKGHSKYILQIAFSADGRFLASTSEDQTIGRWDTKNWTRIMPPLRGHNLEVNALAISRDGRYLATGSKDGEVLLWDTTVPPTTGGRRELPSDLTKVIPTAIGRVVLGESAGGWQQVDLLTLAEQPLPASELSADGSYPAFIPKTSRRPRPAMDEAASGLTGSVTAHAYSPDGRLLVLVSQSGEIGFYDAVSLARIEVLQSNLRTVFGVAFSPDGRRLVLSDGGDEGIAVWDVALRHELLVLPSNGSLLRDVGFTADGNAVVVRSKPKKDQACEFWQAPSFAEIDEAERAGGPWPQAELFPEPSPAPDLAELKRLLEAEYRRVLGLPRMNLPAQAARRQETIDALATLLEQQKKYGEAEPFFRQSLDITKQQAPRDDTVLLEKTRKLLSIVLASLAVERHLANPGDLAAQSTKADAIVDEILAILSRKAAAAASPDETFKLAVFQLWFDQKSELAGTHKRLIKWADQNAEDGSVAQYAAQALSLDPSGDPAFRERAVAFAENAIKLARNAWETAWAYKSLALANYRSRRFKESEQALNLAEQAGAQFEGEQRNLQPQFIGSTTFIRSMILFRTGREAEARELFSKGKMKMNPLPEDDRQLFEYENALHQALVWLAYKEAEALLHEEIPDVAKKAR